MPLAVGAISIAQATDKRYALLKYLYNIQRFTYLICLLHFNRDTII